MRLKWMLVIVAALFPAISHSTAQTSETPESVVSPSAPKEEPEGKSYWERGWWSVEEMADRCRLSASFADDNAILITYNASSDDLFLMFTNSEAMSIKDGEKRNINMYFVGSAKKNGSRSIESEWEELPADVSVAGETRVFSLYLETKPFLAELARYSGMSFQTDNQVVIGNYLLDGSSEAVAQLRKCAFEAAGLNTADPFLK